MPLPAMASNWPTPTANDDNKSPEAHLAMKQRMGERDGTFANRTAITSLQVLVKAWPTPAARDYRSPNSQDSQDRRGRAAATGQQLPNFVEHVWSTPAVADVTGGRKARSGTRSAELLLNGQTEFLSGHLDQTTSTGGERSSTSGLQLNPLFVEWLMGWPTGWTGFACSATELSRFKQRMRSALSQLTLHAAPPAQLSLFG